ncbi:MAG: YccF domain-containing protein [Hyphomicrobiales bacterium]
MRTLLNILWFILGGFLAGLGWWFAGLLCAITIVGLPWARACFMLGSFSFWPFGRDVVSRKVLYGRDDVGTGAFGTIGNVIWLVFAGWWLALGHLALAISLGITIIGIPFAFQHIKLAGASLFPIGQTVVDIDVADAARRKDAEGRADQLRRA